MRIKLSEKYQNEREDICKKIISIIELDENKSFLLCDLDNDIEKQNKIIEMKDDIQKYFACSTISSFKPNFECKRPYLNIIRSILLQQCIIYTLEDLYPHFFGYKFNTFIRKSDAGAAQRLRGREQRIRSHAVDPFRKSSPFRCVPRPRTHVWTYTRPNAHNRV